MDGPRVGKTKLIRRSERAILPSCAANRQSHLGNGGVEGVAPHRPHKCIPAEPTATVSTPPPPRKERAPPKKKRKTPPKKEPPPKQVKKERTKEGRKKPPPTPKKPRKKQKKKKKKKKNEKKKKKKKKPKTPQSHTASRVESSVPELPRVCG